MANNYESLKTDGHYTMARRIFTKIKSWVEGTCLLYGVCDTASSTYIKDISITNFPTNLKVGTTLRVKYTNTVTDNAYSLKINNGTAIPVSYSDDYISSSDANWWVDAGSIVEYTYSGTKWIISKNYDGDFLVRAYANVDYPTDSSLNVNKLRWYFYGAKRGQIVIPQGTQFPEATTTKNGLMSANDKVTLNNALSTDANGNVTITGNYNDVNGKLAHKPLTQDQYNALTQAQQLDGTEYFVRDRVPLQICDYIYPVGAIYMSVTNVSPAVLFGGTWERIEDKFLLAAGSTYNVGATGGEAEHTLITDEIPAHKHRIREEYGAAANTSYPPNNTYSQIAGNNAGTKSWQSDPIENTGGGQPHNNMPPYLVVNVWMRVPDPVEEEEEE